MSYQAEGACAEIDGDLSEASGVHVRAGDQIGNHGQMAARAHRNADGLVGRQFQHHVEESGVHAARAERGLERGARARPFLAQHQVAAIKSVFDALRWARG